MLPKVLATLDRYAAAGVSVVRQFAQPEDWVAKGDHFTSVIQAWDRRAGYDFAIPLDCDEFLALFTPAGLTCGRDAIHAYFDSLIGFEGVFSIDTTNYNVPGQGGWFWPGAGSKRFFAADTIGMLDHGYHVATSRKSDAVMQTHLTHMHFHHKPFAIVLEHSRRKLVHYVDVDDRAALETFEGPNCHLVRHFLQTEQEYLGQFDHKLTFTFTGLATLLPALGHCSVLTTQTAGGRPVRPHTHVTVRQPVDWHGSGADRAVRPGSLPRYTRRRCCGRYIPAPALPLRRLLRRPRRPGSARHAGRTTLGMGACRALNAVRGAGESNPPTPPPPASPPARCPNSPPPPRCRCAPARIPASPRCSR